MATAGEVVTEVRADDSDFDKKMRGVSRRLEKAEQDARRSGRRRGTVIAAGVAGAVAGAVGGAVMSSSPVNSLVQLLLNVVAAAMLPLLVAMLPLIEVLTPALVSISNALAPGIRFLAEKLALLITPREDPNANFTSDELREFRDTGRIGVSATSAKGPPTEPRTVVERVGWAIGDWFEDKASSAWDATKERFSGVGGSNV